MSTFRFTLDGSVLADEPIGWSDAEIEIERDLTLKATFVRYIPELTFWGDGYSILKADLDTNGICAEWDLLIEWSCGGGDYSTLFEGKIYGKEIKIIDLEKCTISTSIEDSGLGARLISVKDVEVMVNIGTTLNGNALTDIGGTTQIHRVSNGIYTYNVETYPIGELLQYMLDYLTDFSITLDSDFFQTETNQIENWEIVWTGTFVTGNIIRIVYTNWFGRSRTATINFLTDQATTLQEINESPALVNQDVSEEGGLHRFEKITDNGVDTNTLECWLPFSIDSVTVTGGASQPTGVATKTQTITRGSRDLVVTNGYRLSGGAANAVRIDLQGLLSQLNRIFNTTFRIFDNAGTPTMQIDVEEDMFDNTTVLTLSNLIGLGYKFTKDYSHFAIKVFGGATVDTNVGSDDINLWSKNTWSTDGCFTNVLNAENKMITDGHLVDKTSDGAITDVNENELYFIEVVDATVSPMQSKRYEHWGYAGGNLFDSSNFNCMITGVHKIWYNFFRLKEGAYPHPLTSNTTSDAVTVTKPLDIQREYKFTKYITDTQAISLVSNVQGKIVFSDSSSGIVNAEGWVKKITYHVADGKTEFLLYTV